MNIHKIGSAEAICLICIVMTNHIIINIPETIIQSTGPSAWLNAIYISLLAVGFTWLICKLFEKFSGKDILDLSEYVGGKWLKVIIGIAYIGLFAIVSGTLLRYFCSRIKINIFSKYSYLYNCCNFFTSCINCESNGITCYNKYKSNNSSHTV